jgi:hypothetical protein
MVDEAKEKESDPKKLLWSFQNLLKDVPDWNIDKVRRETTTVHNLAKCDYLEELLTAVFIAHTKVLSAIRLSAKNKKLQISIPKLDHFLHRTLADCARLIWSNVYLFTPTGTPVERQKNLNAVETLLSEGVLQSIRTMLPVKSILREYLHDDGEDEEVQAPKVVDLSANVVPAADLSANQVPVTVPVPAPVPVPVPVPVTAPETVPVPVPVTTPEMAPETAPVTAPVPVTTPEPVTSSESVPVTAPIRLDLSANVAPVHTIVVDTEPSVRFTNIDSVFHHTDPEQNTMNEVNTIENDLEEETLEFVDEPPTGLEGDYEVL